MGEKIISGLLVVVGIVHLLPLSGMFGATRLTALYGVSIGDKNTEILLRHRAVLFGILAVFFIYAAFNPALQAEALIAAFVSVFSFVALARSIGGYNAELRKVARVDIAIMLCVLAAVIMYYNK